MQLSVVIITFNEERNIERCLKSVAKIADEIVVVDSYSKDKTEEICKKYGVVFLQNPFEGHIQQKNFALAQATNEWVLSLDADEALTPELEQSLLEAKANPLFVGYKMNRLTNYCGHWVKHCGWYPDTKTRFVMRSHARWQGVNPHDRLDLLQNESLGFLKGNLLHYSYYTKADHLKQIEYFGDIASKELFEKGGRSNWFKIVLKTGVQFIKSFFIKKGILDGKTGFLISMRSAYATYRKYYKLLQLQRK